MFFISQPHLALTAPLSVMDQLKPACDCGGANYTRGLKRSGRRREKRKKLFNIRSATEEILADADNNERAS